MSTLPLSSQEWTDGLVPSLVRQCVSDESDCFNWIVFDGPVIET